MLNKIPIGIEISHSWIFNVDRLKTSKNKPPFAHNMKVIEVRG